MPPKQQSKVDLAKKQKIIEDKTFGLKNKNKSKNVQKYVQSLKQSVQPKTDPTKVTAKKKKEEDKAKDKELNDLFKIAVTQPKVPVGVDPKSILCEFYKVGQCAKGFKCKFSHDLNVQRKGEKIDIYSDKRDQDTMEDWDQETLEKVIASKNEEYNQNKPTEIVCKYFLDAVEPRLPCISFNKGAHFDRIVCLAMALKFLNKKGWHTGSLRNIENVWKAEQKHEAEQKKLEELRKQIQEERERSEFRLLQQQAGLVPTQERLDFLYDSGLAVGKGSSSDGFRALELESFPKTKSDPHTPSSSSSTKQQPSVPGALFDEKPHSSNDAWRKLHSDPLLLIRQREQEALARVKNNPIQMAMIRKSVEAKKHKEKICGSKKSQDKHHRKKSNHQKHSSPGRDLDSENASVEREERRYSNCNSSKYERSDKVAPWLERELNERNTERKRNLDEDIEPKRHPATSKSGSAAKTGETQDGSKRNSDKSKRKKDYLEGHLDTDSGGKGKKDHRSCQERRESHRRHRLTPFKLSEEERAARLQEMQVDAKLHEDQRWKRLKQADENDAREATSSSMYSGKNFLHASQRSVYGAENGGSSTIEESVRRRTHYSQRRSEASEGNAFRR